MLSKIFYHEIKIFLIDKHTYHLHSKNSSYVCLFFRYVVNTERYRTSLSIFNLSLMQKIRVSTHFLLNLSMRSLIRFLMKNSGTANTFITQKPSGCLSRYCEYLISYVSLLKVMFYLVFIYFLHRRRKLCLPRLKCKLYIVSLEINVVLSKQKEL